MANSILRRVIGEAAFAGRPDGSGVYGAGGQEFEVPSSDVEHVDLSGVRDQIAAATEPEEATELSLAREALQHYETLPPILRNDPKVQKIAAFIQQIIDLHTPA